MQLTACPGLPVVVGMTDTSVRARASAVTGGGGRSGCAACTVAAACSAASVGLLPKWITYFPAPVRHTSRCGQPGCKHKQAGRHMLPAHAPPAPRLASAWRAWRHGGMPAGRLPFQPATAAAGRLACVGEDLFPKAREVAVDERQRAALLVLQLKVPAAGG